jgi:hypothetical protein
MYACVYVRACTYMRIMSSSFADVTKLFTHILASLD